MIPKNVDGAWPGRWVMHWHHIYLPGTCRFIYQKRTWSL